MKKVINCGVYEHIQFMLQKRRASEADYEAYKNLIVRSTLDDGSVIRDKVINLYLDHMNECKMHGLKKYGLRIRHREEEQESKKNA